MGEEGKKIERESYGQLCEKVKGKRGSLLFVSNDRNVEDANCV